MNNASINHAAAEAGAWSVGPCLSTHYSSHYRKKTTFLHILYYSLTRCLFNIFIMIDLLTHLSTDGHEKTSADKIQHSSPSLTRNPSISIAF